MSDPEEDDWERLRYSKLCFRKKLRSHIEKQPTSEMRRHRRLDQFTGQNLVNGTSVWCTNPCDPLEEHSVVIAVTGDDDVTSFSVASITEKVEMCVEEVATDGTVGEMLVTWGHYGFRAACAAPKGCKPSDYTPISISTETKAKMFKVSVRHRNEGSNYCSGVAIFDIFN